MYHGWSDWLVVPRESINYRNAVASGKSGRNLDDFYRLFMVPGMTHCSGGVGPDHFDALGPMVDWVEKNRAPDKIIASQFSGGEVSGTALRTRPLCPYLRTRRSPNIKGTVASMMRQTSPVYSGQVTIAEWLPIYDRQPDRARKIARTINGLCCFRVVGWLGEEDVVDVGLRVPVI
jgi:hypothetical protein